MPEEDIKRRLLADAQNADAWEGVGSVPPSSAPRPRWYPAAAEIPADERLAPEAQVNRLLSSAETLFADGEIEAAAMLAWSATEAILRRSALSAAPELERQSSARVLKHLYSLGRIEPGTYKKLLLLMQFRNAVSHGFEPRTAAPSIPDVMPDIRRLQRAA
jgi:hypothetical protein